MKIIEVIDKIRDFHGKQEHSRFDRILYGDAERECTGIAVTCCGTVEVIQKAFEAGANLLIVHENIFYTSTDDDSFVQNVALVEEKKKLLEKTGIVIWRDHDHMHGGGPGGKPNDPGGRPDFAHFDPHKNQGPREKTDYIYYGIMKMLGWEPYLQGDIKKPLLYEIPETTIPELCRFLMERFDLNGVRVVGKSDGKVRRVFICEHVSDRHDESLYSRMDELNADVFLPLEIVDWTLSEYVRDAVALGQNKAILELGHFNFEEPGMRYMAEEWLPKLIGTDIPVSFIQSGDSFSYFVR